MTKDIIFSFQGVHGAYSELAGKNLYPDSKSIPCKTFEEMFEVVRINKANLALVPIENSRAGRVADTQRLIPESQLKIIGEYFLEVNHCLVALSGASLKNIKRVHSHEQAITQCRNKLIRYNKDMVVAADTAGAAKMISEMKNIEDAAIASKLADDTITGASFIDSTVIVNVCSAVKSPSLTVRVTTSDVKIPSVGVHVINPESDMLMFSGAPDNE